MSSFSFSPTWKRLSNKVTLSNVCLDVGACQLIIDGKIKIKNDAQIQGFTKTGLKFDNGSEVEADVVMYATG